MDVYIRVEGNNKIGYGHVKRCIDFSNHLINNPTVENIFFLMKDEYFSNLIPNNYPIIPFKKYNELASRIQNKDVIITDFLNTNIEEIKKIKSVLTKRIFSFDAFYKIKYLESEVVVQTNVFRDDFTVKGTKYFFGPKYILLDKKIKKYIKPYTSKNVKNILIIFGGTDPNNFTEKIVELLNKQNIDSRINLVTGPGYEHPRKIDKKIRNYGLENILHMNDPPNLYSLMKKVDLAVTAAGTTLYELSRIGVPSIVLPQVTHQEKIAYHFQENKACINLGKNPSPNKIMSALNKTQNYDIRKNLVQNSKKICDGKGIDRLTKIFEKYFIK